MKKNFPKGLIVSSQALEGNPMKSTEKLASMAEAAAIGGAAALRVDGADMVRELKKRTNVPIIAIRKIRDASGRIVITPDFASAKELCDAGADIIALDATFYPSELKEDTRVLIERIHTELGAMVMADISTAEEARAAAEMGADAVSTTLAGYVPGALHSAEELYEPNLELVRTIAAMKLPCALVVEGRIWERADLIKAFELGADAVVIGKAITNPMAITKYFLSGVPADKR
jgi:putative N-acetylmannosamine-6-phosphate epimerase